MVKGCIVTVFNSKITALLPASKAVEVFSEMNEHRTLVSEALRPKPKPKEKKPKIPKKPKVCALFYGRKWLPSNLLQ